MIYCVRGIQGRLAEEASHVYHFSGATLGAMQISSTIQATVLAAQLSGGLSTKVASTARARVANRHWFRGGIVHACVWL